MSHVIIGTAGHIDHGKTALIRALTGRDTDRLEEEKRRGITIDLGFTWFDLPDGERAGIIDVPGHEKFIPEYDCRRGRDGSGAPCDRGGRGNHCLRPESIWISWNCWACGAILSC